MELLRVRYALAFMRALKENGIDGISIWKDVGLAAEILEDPETWMPLKDLFGFLDTVVQCTGYDTLGLDAGIAPRLQHSDFSLKTLLSPSLFEALSLICRMSMQEDTSAHFRLLREGPYYWMRCQPMEGNEEGIRQVEIFRYAAILEIIRFSSDDDWLPPHVDFQSSLSQRALESTLLAGLEIQFDMPYMQIAIPPLLLSRQVNRVPIAPHGQSHFSKQLQGFERVLLEVVRYNVLSGRFRLQDTALAMEYSPRSFQRRLAEMGIMFSNLLLKVRIDTAMVWLSGGDKPISEIAARLGYRECTNFSRTFRRTCGLSPREYRQLMKAGLEA